VRIGVVIPAYNAASWIADAIRSVLAQTHRDWRLVVVDDGSTDGTGDVVAGFPDPRIRLTRQANGGVSAARNAGIRELSAWCGINESPSGPARAPPSWRGLAPPSTSLLLASRKDVDGRAKPGHDDWGAVRATAEALVAHQALSGDTPAAFLFLDADDWLAPDALERLAAALAAAPHAVAASGPCAFIDTGRVRRPPSGHLLHRLLVRNLFANGGHLLLRAVAVRAAGGFVPGIAYGEDWEFWIHIALQGPFAALASRAPVLFVRQCAAGAYRRLASDPAAFAPCMDAIFGNPALLARLGPRRLAAIRRRTEAENQWIIGRELIRGGKDADGRTWLRRSVLAGPTPRRAVLLAIAHLLPLVPPGLRGPFRAYRLLARPTQP
jgi:glycosyltransferase involved in cell wall biosynthesis